MVLAGGGAGLGSPLISAAPTPCPVPAVAAQEPQQDWEEQISDPGMLLLPPIPAFSKRLLRAQAWFEMKIYGSLTGSQIGLITELLSRAPGLEGRELCFHAPSHSFSLI